MSIDLTKLASQGRAFSGARPWSEEEQEALKVLVEGGISRPFAADYIRNGITTVEDVEKAEKKGIAIKSVEVMTEEAVEKTQKENADTLDGKKSSKK